MGIPLMTGLSSAEQASCNLRVSVEAGEGNANNWVSRTRLTDEFKARIDISGVTGTNIALLVALLNPEGKLIKPHSTTFEPSWSSGFVVPGKTWNGLLGGLPSGTYRFHATVADSGGDFGVATSRPFEVA